MITPLTQTEIKKIFEVDVSPSPKVTHLGGLAVWTAYLRKIEFKERLTAVLGPPLAEACLETMLLGVFAGGDSMEKIATLAKDKSIKDYLGCVVSETQITRRLAKNAMNIKLSRASRVFQPRENLWKGPRRRMLPPKFIKKPVFSRLNRGPRSLMQDFGPILLSKRTHERQSGRQRLLETS